MKSSSREQCHIDVASYHEAGHALAALYEGRQLFGIAVSLGDPGNGLCLCASRPASLFNLTNNSGTAQAAWMHTLSTTCADIRIYLAGPLAEARALGTPLRSLGARSDLEYCLNMAVRLNHLGDFVSQFTEIALIDVEKIMDTQRCKTRRWLARPKVWKTIELIAGILSSEGNLNIQQLNYLIGAAGLPDKQFPLNFL